MGCEFIFADDWDLIVDNARLTGTTKKISFGSFSLIPTGFAENIPSLINAVLSFVMVIVVLLVFFQLIMAGFYWITSGGDKTKTESARNRIVSTVMGLLIVSASYAILILLLNFLGFENLNDVFENVRSLETSPV